MTNVPSNKIKYLLSTGGINFSSDAFKIILMVSGFTFNKDTHHKYADVVASELATAFGYTQGTKALAGVTVTENDTDDRCDVTWTNVTWTAAGGVIGPTPGAIIYDDTDANDSIVGYIDFGGDVTQPDGGVLTLTTVGVRLS